MIDTTYRPELAELDDLIGRAIEHDVNASERINADLSEYPVVWDALFENIEPDDEEELARQAERLATQIRRDIGEIEGV